MSLLPGWRRDMVFILGAAVMAFACGTGYSVVFRAPVMTDAKQYDMLAWNIAQGRGYVDETAAPTMFREPAYPFFLSLIYRTFGHSYGAVLTVQSVLFAGITVLSFLLAKDIFGTKTAIPASIAVALFPTLGDYTIYLLSEIFFTFCLMLFIFVISRSLKYGSLAGVFLSGLILAILTLTKAIMIFSVLFIIAGFFAFDIGKDGFWKKFLLKSLLLVFSFSICVLPWMTRNERIFGTYSIALRGGKALYNRAIKLDYGWDRWNKLLVFSVSEFLGDKLYPDTAVESNQLLLTEDRLAQDRLTMLINEGLTPSEADKTLAAESMRKIALRPFVYLGQSLFESVKLLGFTHIPSLNETDVSVFFMKHKNGKIALSAIRGIFRLLAYPIILFCTAGLIVNLKDWRKWIFMFLIISYLHIVYGLTFSWPRYTVPLIPCYLILATAFFTRGGISGEVKNKA